ncbi:hypothetical protein [Mucilaginibacter myungsuensis]|uniref:Uncharacterized protein n=1 Tax=Mucilaginibacter myungsuensis TaxID=649104 RepID=A0A929KZ57_9SPHI|nr:hypothetical protein [Mucilaginibacter myungsuensis]MBE9662618.1 hypothetical protein [Mucilaginibacter myungsuensis]MDN3598038.1 hypothetical protein [Mucilaginibacter myungsuensis]
MRKILLLTLLIIGGLYGCKKGYDESTSTNTLIVGKWGHVKDSIINFVNDTSVVTVQPGGVDSIEFNKGTSGSDSFTNFRYELRGYFLTLKYPSYVSVNNITVPATDYDLKIRSLTKNDMVLFFDFTERDSIGRLNGSTVFRTYSK